MNNPVRWKRLSLAFRRSDAKTCLPFKLYVKGYVVCQPICIRRLASNFCHIFLRKSFYRIRQDASWPITQPLTYFQAARTNGVQDERRWKGPIAMYIHATYKMFKGCQKVFVVSEKLWMFKFNRRHYRQAWMIVPEIVIELISFIHKVLAFAYTIIDAEPWDNRAYFTGWIKPGIHKHEREHCRRSALTMNTTDRENALSLHPFS